MEHHLPDLVFGKVLPFVPKYLDLNFSQGVSLE